MPARRAMIVRMRWSWWMIAGALMATAAASTVWQPLTDYSISFPGDRTNAAPTINPFENFTHFATDFGWMGPGQARIDAKAGAIRTKPEGEWTGVWHSLAGLAMDNDRRFNANDVTGLGGPPEKRAKVTALTIDVRGSGVMRVELADAGKRVSWARTLQLQPGEKSRQRFAVDANELGPLKYLNWVAETGSALEVSAIGFEVERPEMSPEEWLFRASLGKLRRCHDLASGLTRDRAHIPAGTFDSVASSGLHALASAAAAADGVLEREEAEAETRHTAQAVLSLTKAGGFLPHFTRRDAEGVIRIHPGTEYSTIDTAIVLISLRLAGDILELDDVRAAVDAAVSQLQFDLITDSEGWIGHGFAEDGTSPLAGQWRDWGGETALVLALEAMVPGRPPRGRMAQTGQVFRGVGFIGEIQSLFYPDFDRPEPDAVSGISWPAARRSLYLRQASYVVNQWPGSAAANGGIYGISAGESGMPGAGYSANGVDLPGIRWLHPHEMVMASALTGRENFTKDILRLETAGLLVPTGLPENVEIGLTLDNPMQGSLNAGFEALAAYHGWKGRGAGNAIDRACRADPLLRRGAARFFPGSAGDN